MPLIGKTPLTFLFIMVIDIFEFIFATFLFVFYFFLICSFCTHSFSTLFCINLIHSFSRAIDIYWVPTAYILFQCISFASLVVSTSFYVVVLVFLCLTISLCITLSGSIYGVLMARFHSSFYVWMIYHHFFTIHLSLNT